MKTKPPIPKSEAKKIVAERSKEMTPAELKKKSDLIIEKFIELDDYIIAKKILLYFSTLSQLVQTKYLIDLAVGQGKCVFLPKFNRQNNRFRRFQFSAYNELLKNEEGFFEPKLSIEEDLSDIDLIIVPCVAVSLTGQRVGFDYSGYISMLKNSFAVKAALAYEFQLFHRIEYEKKDIFVDKIITERRVIKTREI